MHSKIIACILLCLVISTPLYANIFGPDKRVEQDLNPNNQFAPIVKILSSQPKGEYMRQYHCSGALVGPDMVLTSAHCFIHLYKKIEIFVGYREGKFWDQTTKAGVITDGKLATEFRTKMKVGLGSEHDWVIIKTKAPLGNKYGYFSLPKEGSLTADKNTGTQSIYFLSYANDFYKGERLSFQRCMIQKVDGNYLNHDCATNFGASGGALLSCSQDHCTVLGVNSFAAVPPEAQAKGANMQFEKYIQKYPNVALSAAFILDVLKSRYKSLAFF